MAKARLAGDSSTDWALAGKFQHRVQANSQEAARRRLYTKIREWKEPLMQRAQEPAPNPVEEDETTLFQEFGASIQHLTPREKAKIIVDLIKASKESERTLEEVLNICRLKRIELSKTDLKTILSLIFHSQPKKRD